MPQDFSSLSQILIADINDQSFVASVFIGIIIFSGICKVGKILHSILVPTHMQKQFKPTEFSIWFAMVIHAVITFIPSYFMLWKFTGIPIEDLEDLQESDPDFIYVNLYRISILASISYFLVAVPYELFWLKQPSIQRVVMTLHHIIAILAQAGSYPTNPLIPYVASFGFQVEFSSIPLALTFFGKAMDNQVVYFIGGLGTMIFYPLTRVVFLIFTIHRTYQIKPNFISHTGVDTFYLGFLGQIFVMMMSMHYTSVLFTDPKRFLFLRAEKERIVASGNAKTKEA